MELLKAAIFTGLDAKQHYGVVTVGHGNWPIAIGGLAEGSRAAQSEKEMQFLASASVMHDMLSDLVQEFGNINPEFPIGAGKCAHLKDLVDRAQTLVTKFQSLRFVRK